MKFSNLAALAVVVGAGILSGAYLYKTEVVDRTTWVDVYQSTVKLMINNQEFCSGTFIDEDTILTAAHCTEQLPDGQLYVITYDGHTWPVTIDKRAHNYDTATLELFDGYAWNHSVDVVSPDQDLPIGTSVWMSGFPDITLLGEWRLHEGIVVAEGKFVYWADESLSTTVVVTGGASGGGLYAIIDGKITLVGTTQGMYSWMPNVSYFSTPEGVNAVVNED